VPQNSIVLSSVWVPAAATSITSGDLNDLRVFARTGTGGQTGHTNIATSQSTSSTSYTTLATPDQVSGIVMPTNGLIAVWYQAAWTESVSNTGRAALFLGGNQQKIAMFGGPVTVAASTGGALTVGDFAPLVSCGSGLVTLGGGSSYSGDVTTGQAVGELVQVGSGGFTQELAGTNTPVISMGGGPCYIFAAAGTYTVSVQFKASSGNVTAQNRKLWVQAIPFS